MNKKIIIIAFILLIVATFLSGCIDEQSPSEGFKTIDGSYIIFDRDEIREIIPMDGNTTIKFKDGKEYIISGEYSLYRDSMNILQLGKK